MWMDFQCFCRIPRSSIIGLNDLAFKKTMHFVYLIFFIVVRTDNVKSTLFTNF